MTTTMLDVEAIEALDFTPACGSPMCENGHPVATHVGSATCGCHCLLCLACAEYLITKLNEPCAGYDCSLCGRAIDGIGRFGDFVRVVPL